MGNHSLFAGDMDECDAEEVRLIAAAWNAITAEFDPAETIWEVLRPLEREVSECLSKQSHDLVRARRVTAQAFWLIDTLGRG